MSVLGRILSGVSCYTRSVSFSQRNRIAEYLSKHVTSLRRGSSNLSCCSFTLTSVVRAAGDTWCRRSQPMGKDCATAGEEGAGAW